MYYRRAFRRRPRYTYKSSQDELKLGGAPHRPPRRSGGISLILFLCSIFIFLACALAFLKDLSTQIAVSDASDVVIASVNNSIADIMKDGDYTGDYFVNFEKTESGDISAISSNMARINALSARILDTVINATENQTITVEIPIGNLTGVSLLMGRGPKVPVQIIVLTSSKVEFSNSIITAGINQTKHQINLEVIVDIDVLIPWDTASTQVKTEVLIADTVIVGKVPETYMNMNAQ